MSIEGCVCVCNKTGEALCAISFLVRSITKHKQIQFNHFSSQHSLLKIAELRYSQEKHGLFKTIVLKTLELEKAGREAHQIEHPNCEKGSIVHLHLVLEQQRPARYTVSWQLQKLIFKPLMYCSLVVWHLPLVCLVSESVAQATALMQVFNRTRALQGLHCRDSKCQHWDFSGLLLALISAVWA